MSLAAQSDQVIDSLEQAIITAATDQQRIGHYARLADLTVYNNPQKSLAYSLELLRLSQSLKNDFQIAEAYYKIGSAYWSIGDLAMALEHMQYSMPYLSPTENPDLYSRVYMRIGAIYSASDDNVKGIYYYNKAIPYFDLVGDNFIKFAIYSNIGKSLMDISYLDSAAYYFKEAYAQSSDIPQRFLPILLFNMADLQFQQNSLETSLQTLTVCDSLALAYGDLRSQIRVAQLRAEIALLQKDFPQAQAYILFATQEAEKTQVKELIAITHETYAKVLEELNQNDAAFQALKTSQLYFDSIQSVQAKNKLELYNFDESEQEKEELRKQQEISELKASNRQLIALAASVIALLMLAVAVTNIRRQQMIKKQNVNLKEKNILIEKQRAQLDYLNNFKSKVMGIMAHDMKGPLQSIFGIMDILNHQLMSPDELKEFIPHVNNQLSQVNLLLNNIFEWSKAGINEDYIKISKIDIHHLITESIQENQHTAESKKLKIVNNIPTELMAKADPNMIKVVIRNLFYNAIKYSNESGSITFDGVSQTNTIEISIADQGVGMSQETIEKLFSYDTESQQGTAKEIGTGFGLIVCKDFVQMNNGTITVSSERGKGSLFTITIPKA